MGKTFRHNKWDEENEQDRKFIKRKKHTRLVKTERGFEERHNRKEMQRDLLDKVWEED